MTTLYSEIVVNSFFSPQKDKPARKDVGYLVKKSIIFQLFYSAFVDQPLRLLPYTCFLRPNRRNKLVLKMNGDIAGCEMRPANASLPVFLMRALAQQG